jgi:hypothetical protein
MYDVPALDHRTHLRGANSVGTTVATGATDRPSPFVMSTASNGHDSDTAGAIESLHDEAQSEGCSASSTLSLPSMYSFTSQDLRGTKMPHSRSHSLHHSVHNTDQVCTVSPPCSSPSMSAYGTLGDPTLGALPSAHIVQLFRARLAARVASSPSAPLLSSSLHESPLVSALIGRSFDHAGLVAQVATSPCALPAATVSRKALLAISATAPTHPISRTLRSSAGIVEPYAARSAPPDMIEACLSALPETERRAVRLAALLSVLMQNDG